MKIVRYIFEKIQIGFSFICTTISKGFFFYIYLISAFLDKLFSYIKKTSKKLQSNPIASFIFFFTILLGIYGYTYLYHNSNIVTINIDNNKVVDVTNSKGNRKVNSDETSMETNLFRRYAKTSIEEINFDNLRNVNDEVVNWIIVDKTDINYPVVKTKDNDFYLNHDLNKRYDSSGWIFMDYRNSNDLRDKNTIFYGHNLLNKTSFGSVANMFTDEWFNNSNHSILVINENGQNIYQVFSIYYIDPVTDYLQINFDSNEEFAGFIKMLKERSIYNFHLDVTYEDSIITLSTCTDDNKGRRVIHAKKIN